MTEEQFSAHQVRLRGPTLAPPQAGLELGGLRKLEFILPFPPSVNDLYGISKEGRKYLVDEQRRFRTVVCTKVRREMRGEAPLTGWLRMTVILWPPDRRLRDGSNCIKAIEDALQHAKAFVNDYQIDHHEILRVRSDLRGQCSVTLEEIAV
jgi:crossover junction endodeoxyribonuclease RusA